MEAKLSLEALKASVLPTLDITAPQGTGLAKFKRVRQPAGAAPTSNNDTISNASPASSLATQTTTTSIATTMITSITPMTAPAPVQYSSAAATVTAATSAKRQATMKQQSGKPVPYDLQAAANAIFAPLTPVTTPDFNSDSADVSSTISLSQDGAGSEEAGKKKRRRKSKGQNKDGNNNNNNNNDTSNPAVGGEAASEGSKPAQHGANKRQKVDHKHGKQQNNNPHNKKPRISNAAYMEIKKFGKLARSLDAQPELVGVSTKPEDDFDTLLNQHFVQANKMMQRDIAEQTRKAAVDLKKKERELAAVQAQMMKAVEAASNPQPLPVAEPVPAASLSTKATTATTAADGIQGGKKSHTFVPRRDCVYYIKGRCFKDKECTFKHDPSMVQAVETQIHTPNKESEEVRRSRGICKFHKTGCCTRGDFCRQSHDLKSDPCTYYHLQGQCNRGDECQFGHTPLTPAERQALQDEFTSKMKRKQEAQAAQAALGDEIAARMSAGSIGTQGLIF